MNECDIDGGILQHMGYLSGITSKQWGKGDMYFWRCQRCDQWWFSFMMLGMFGRSARSGQWPDGFPTHE